MSNQRRRSCERCRNLKVRCDRSTPSCSRCVGAKSDCSLGQQQPTTSTLTITSPLPRACTPSDSSSSPDFYLSIPLSPAVLDTLSPDECETRRHECEVAPGSTLNGGDVKIKRKRRRACLSCTRCHRLKVKCDKKEPCGRCRLSGWGKQCEYTHRIESDETLTSASASASASASVSDSVPSPYALIQEDPQVALETWHSRHRGLSHWKNLLSKLGSNFTHPLAFVPSLATEEVIRRKHSTAAGLILPDNFPFNSPRAVPFISLEKVHSLLESHRAECPDFVDAYLDLYQAVYPIIDSHQFQERIGAYWDDPTSADAAWLSQFLMVLALGQIATTKEIIPTVQLCMAAEACLGMTPFMLRPSIATMRTLCLMILAKLTANGTCWSFDACWNLLGFIVRLAICLGFHRSEPPAHSSPVVYKDWEAGQVIWSVILHFNIQVSMTAGMPSCISADDVASSRDSLPWNCTVLGTAAVAWRTVIHISCPTIIRIISRVNSDPERPSYEEILDYSSQIRQLMGVLDRIQGPRTLRITLDIFFRRVLLVLHRRHALEADAPTKYPVSYWASLECSLALLVHQRDLCDSEDVPKRNDLLFRLYMLDVFAAAVTATIHLLRKDAPLAAGFAIPPRQTILETLQACTELWAKETMESPCFRIGHLLLKEIVNALAEGRQR